MGQARGGPLTITYAVSGSDTNLKSYLKSTLFVNEPIEERIGRVPLWRLGPLIDDAASDLTFIAAGKYLIRNLPAQNVIVLPRFVNQTLDVKGEWEEVLQRFHRGLRRHEVRLVRKHGYEYEVSNKDEDFNVFFYEMYLPTMRKRHGDQARLTSYAKAYRTYRHGILFLVKRESTYVSGVLCRVERGSAIVHFLMVGVKQADSQLMKEGAQGALYYAVIHWANQQGYAGVDFQGTDPYLRKGILQHKKKWGAAARIQSHKRIWIRIHQNTSAVNQFMKDNPCIIINGQGDLQGLFFTDEPDNVPSDTNAAWESLCAMPGLSGYRTCSVEDFLDNSHPV